VTILRVEVTHDDIARGEREKPCECPVALALKRAGCTGVEVWEGEVLGWFEGIHFQVPPPDAVDRFVEAFDNGGVSVPSVAPFTFDLDIGEAP
jgi:hypothetical protein